MSHGINIEDTSPTIQDCIIQNNKGAGFFDADSSATIINNTIRNNHLGLLIWTATDDLRNNTIQNNTGGGLVLDRGQVSVMYNRFYDNKGYGIVIFGAPGPVLYENVFVNNTRGDIDRRPRANSDALTMLGTLISVPIIILPLMALGRSRERMFRKIERQQKD
jgi:parallel beta-helix repeat protein